MTASSPRSQKKSRGRILIIATLLAAAAVVYVVYRNNTEIFAGKSVQSAADRREPAVLPAVDVRQPGSPVPQGRNRPMRDTAAPKPVAPAASRTDAVSVSASPKLRQSVVLPNIDCAILDNATVHVVLSLELFFEDDGLRDEIMSKREQLKVMVRKVLSTKRFDEIQVEPLRNELRSAMNLMLSNGALTDIEFRAFRIQ